MTSRDLKLQFSYELLERLLVKEVSWNGWLWPIPPQFSISGNAKEILSLQNKAK